MTCMRALGNSRRLSDRTGFCASCGSLFVAVSGQLSPNLRCFRKQPKELQRSPNPGIRTQSASERAKSKRGARPCPPTPHAGASRVRPSSARAPWLAVACLNHREFGLLHKPAPKTNSHESK